MLEIMNFECHAFFSLQQPFWRAADLCHPVFIVVLGITLVVATPSVVGKRTVRMHLAVEMFLSLALLLMLLLLSDSASALFIFLPRGFVSAGITGVAIRASRSIDHGFVIIENNRVSDDPTATPAASEQGNLHGAMMN